MLVGKCTPDFKVWAVRGKDTVWPKQPNKKSHVPSWKTKVQICPHMEKAGHCTECGTESVKIHSQARSPAPPSRCIRSCWQEAFGPAAPTPSGKRREGLPKTGRTAETENQTSFKLTFFSLFAFSFCISTVIQLHFLKLNMFFKKYTSQKYFIDSRSRGHL